MNVLKAAFLYIFLACWLEEPAQAQSLLTDGRVGESLCTRCRQLINSKPKEVLFGITVNEGGDIFFEMNNEEWFNKMFSPGMSITVDIVTGDRYNCTTSTFNDTLFRGYVLPLLRYEDFKNNMLHPVSGYTTIKIGKIPAELRKKQIEANLVIVNHDKVCYYTNFVNIDRSVWDILPMGLYTDALLKEVPDPDTVTGNKVAYEQKVQVVIPFDKNKDVYNGDELEKVYDSLHLQNYILRKADIRAYTSVEGMEAVNKQLMKGRANTMMSALRKLQPGMKNVNITTAENWLQFYQEIKNTRFNSLTALSRAEIKVKLLDTLLADSLEPILANERIAILTLYYDQRTGSEEMKNQDILASFAKAIAAKKINQARMIQKEIFERISDQRLPDSYLDKLEIPQAKAYWELLNDHVIYKYRLNLSDENDALEAFRKIRALDPTNGKINYNIGVLTIFKWHASGELANTQQLLGDINKLPEQGINRSLIRRMLVNYHILLSVDLLQKYKYDQKDQSVLFIKENYEGLPLTDEDRYSLAKYFTFYSQDQWAVDLIARRIDQLDVSEDLVFYYVNLGFFKPANYRGEKFSRALLNAATLNKERFCRFFNPINRGGASMQLLEESLFRKLYCENCTQSH